MTQCKALGITVEDITHIARNAYDAFYSKHVRPQLAYSSINYGLGDFVPFVWQGMKEAFITYCPCKGMKFTSHLYSRVTYRLLDAWRDLFSLFPKHEDVVMADVFPTNRDVLEEASRNDGMDEFGKYLWMRNEPQLFMLLPLTTLGYSNREMAQFMMKDEKTIRKWMRKLDSYAHDFNTTLRTHLSKVKKRITPSDNEA